MFDMKKIKAGRWRVRDVPYRVLSRVSETPHSRLNAWGGPSGCRTSSWHWHELPLVGTSVHWEFGGFHQPCRRWSWFNRKPNTTTAQPPKCASHNQSPRRSCLPRPALRRPLRHGVLTRASFQSQRGRARMASRRSRSTLVTLGVAQETTTDHRS